MLRKSEVVLSWECCGEYSESLHTEHRIDAMTVVSAGAAVFTSWCHMKSSRPSPSCLLNSVRRCRLAGGKNTEATVSWSVTNIDTWTGDVAMGSM